MAENIADNQWYVVTTYAQHEAKTKENLEKRRVNMKMEDEIKRILICEQEVPVLKDGLPTGKTKKVNLYPGYLFTREQIEPVLKRMGIVDESMYTRYQEGLKVKIISGPLEGTEGTIVSIDKEHGMVRVNTVFFGRVTPVDLDFSEIDLI